jgi:hypothetical protein
MAAPNYQTSVAYSGTDYGRIYLGDIGQRNQLGNGLGLYHQGQDHYISHGQTLNLVTTGDVLLSANKGRIKKFVDKGAFVVTNS